MNSSQEFFAWLSSDDDQAFVASSHSLPAHALCRPWLWMATSGTTSSNGQATRWIAHTKKSLLTSAQAVCDWFSVGREDVWGRVLPRTHMGGLSIDVRSVVSRCKVLEGPSKWSASDFKTWVDESKITLTSLVPTQVYDLCQGRLQAPRSLRAAIVGADRLDDELMMRAKNLGWPIVRTYGSTETASMVCSESPFSSSSETEGLRALSHAQVRLSDSQLLEIRSPSLFCAELVWELDQDQMYIQEREGDWWTTSDRARIEHDRVVVEGRVDDFVKIYGILVHLPTLDRKLNSFLNQRGVPFAGVFVSFDDPRVGARLEIRIAGPFHEGLLAQWNAYCLGNERASHLRSIPVLPKTTLGKLRRNQLRDT